MSRAWFKFYGRDFRDGVRDLTFDVVGIYTVLLTLMYEEQGGRIRDHDQRLARLIGCDIRMWKRARATLIEAGKLYLTEDGFLANDRADLEAKSAELLSEVRAKSGRSSRQLKPSDNDKSLKTNESTEANAPNLRLYARALPESESDITLSSLRSESVSPHPKKRAAKPSASKTKIPIDLAMTEQARAFASERGFVNGTLDEMWTHFTAYHAGKGTLTSSVEASWRTWVLNQAKFQGERHDHRTGFAGDRGERARPVTRSQPRSAASIIMERALADELDRERQQPKLDLLGD